MKKKMVVIIMLLLLNQIYVYSDTIPLKSGKDIDCVIIEETDESVKAQVEYGAVVIEKDKILPIDRKESKIAVKRNEHPIDSRFSLVDMGNPEEIYVYDSKTGKYYSITVPYKSFSEQFSEKMGGSMGGRVGALKRRRESYLQSQIV